MGEAFWEWAEEEWPSLSKVLDFPRRQKAHAVDGVMRGSLMVVGVAFENVPIDPLAAVMAERSARTAEILKLKESMKNPDLLTNVCGVFGENDQLSTESILRALHKIENAIWFNLGDGPLDSKRLAYMLKKYGVRPRKMDFKGRKLHGYLREDLHEAWIKFRASP